MVYFRGTLKPKGRMIGGYHKKDCESATLKSKMTLESKPKTLLLQVPGMYPKARLSMGT